MQPWRVDPARGRHRAEHVSVLLPEGVRVTYNRIRNLITDLVGMALADGLLRLAIDFKTPTRGKKERFSRKGHHFTHNERARMQRQRSELQKGRPDSRHGSITSVEIFSQPEYLGAHNAESENGAILLTYVMSRHS